MESPGPRFSLAFWVRQSDTLSADIFLAGVLGFARCSYLGSVDLTLSGISITQGSAALKWLPASLEVSAGCGMYLQGKSVILFPGD